MSMIGCLQQLSNEDKTKADADPQQYRDWIFEEHDDCYEFDNYWDYLSYIYAVWMKKEGITNVPNPVSPRKGDAVCYVGPDLGYGESSYLTPEQVKTVYEFLKTLDVKTVLEYGVTQTEDAPIYPDFWPGRFANDHDWLMSYMSRMTGFYRDAVEKNMGMLQAIT